MRESGEALVKSLGITPGLKVLDLGGGDGTTALSAAKLAHPGDLPPGDGLGLTAPMADAPPKPRSPTLRTDIARIASRGRARQQT
jgi:hypothetical protein